MARVVVRVVVVIREVVPVYFWVLAVLVMRVVVVVVARVVVRVVVLVVVRVVVFRVVVVVRRRQLRSHELTPLSAPKSHCY